jgi:hypothetical protein
MPAKVQPVEFVTQPTAPDPKQNDVDDDLEGPHRYSPHLKSARPRSHGARDGEHLFLTSAEEPANVPDLKVSKLVQGDPRGDDVCWL